MTYQLRKEDQILAEQPTKEQCAVEAYERGLVICRRGKHHLVDGVAIEEARP